MAVVGLVDEELTALETATTENLHQELEELCIIHRTREMIMTEVAGTIVVVLTTCTAYFPVLQDAHTGIEEASQLALGDRGGSYFTYRATNNLIRTEDTKLDAYNRLCF
jgi:hypothetical protein